MIRNHFKYAFGNLLHTKTFCAINIIGLAISLTAFILMRLYIDRMAGKHAVEV